MDLSTLYHVCGKHNPADIGTRPEVVTEKDVGPGSRFEQGDYWMTLEKETAVSEGYITPAAEIKISPEKLVEFQEGLLMEPEKPEILVKGHTCNDFPVSLSSSTPIPSSFAPATARKDLISQRAIVGKYDPQLLPT